MIQTYSDNCDYLRKKLKLRDDINLYDLVSAATDYIRNLDDKEELVKLTEEVKPISQEKKRGRPKKSSSN